MAAAETTVYDKLPGWEIVAAGLADIAAGRRTPSACAVWIAAPRLRRAGLLTGSGGPAFSEPERELYRLLRLEPGDAYARYNAILRRLVSFQRAVSRAKS